MSTPHTPGPWKWFNYPDGRKLLAARDRAVIHCPDAPMAIDAADAAMIEAAPEMLAALRKVPLVRLTDDALGWQCVGCGSVCGTNPDGSERDEDCAPDCYVAIVEAAIAKAEGQSGASA